MNCDRDSGHTQIHFSPMVYEKVWFRSWKKQGCVVSTSWGRTCSSSGIWRSRSKFCRIGSPIALKQIQNCEKKFSFELVIPSPSCGWRLRPDCEPCSRTRIFFFFFLPVSKILRSFQSQLHSEETNLKVPHTLDMWQLLGEPQEVSLWTVRRWFLIGMFVRRGVTWRDQRRPQVTRSRLGIIRETRWVREYVGTLQEWN